MEKSEGNCPAKRASQVPSTIRKWTIEANLEGAGPGSYNNKPISPSSSDFFLLTIIHNPGHKPGHNLGGNSSAL